MYALMTKPLLPCVWQQESTPDGFAEVTIEVNGRILATEVIGRGQEDVEAALSRLYEELRKRC